ncbi:tetratricopeptide repeat protein 4-like [Orbicella faveolata]|uniref:tetratricopeptide repeat protein 4-like n=1 Tax=Orbicella faveolata TaxID=48498 RepID=UPI0009E651A4|nr:tetratricopeptide repeat protein 4-like [Orbicella faveolata]
MAESQNTSPFDVNLDFDDDTLKAIAQVYSNRAAAHFRLGNFQETLNDATAAVTLQPTFIKAIERGASACVKLKRYEEVTTWCDKGLAIDNNNKTLVDLRTKCVSEPNTLQETKRQNMKRMPVTHTATGQVNIVTIKGGLV